MHADALCCTIMLVPEPTSRPVTHMLTHG